uniref:TxnO8 n=1 Tax=Streptomyces bottropensis TaxID=42235 RepID=A0A0K1H336_9ACTN|nr:TxnO8 [Streptomyces bottropensis]
MHEDTPRIAETALSVEKLYTLATQQAGTADRTGRLAPEVADALREAGFARHFVAARQSGSEGSFADLTQAVVTLGQACPATAWCASLSAYSARFAGHLPHEGQRALWDGGPDTLIATALMPGGQADAVDGGWRLKGRWSYVSGIDFADWVLLCGRVDSGEGTPGLRFFALPREACTVHDDWDSIGMRATASHTVVVDSATVPDHLTFDRGLMVTGRNPHSDVPAHNVPFQAVGGLTFIAPVIGAGLGALTAFATGLTGRRRTVANESALVRASGRIDAARHLVEENTQVLDERRFTPEHMARNERNATFAAEAVREAVGLLVAAAGTAGLGCRHPLQRLWRDVTSATSHVALQYDTAARKNYSAVLAGPAE